MSLRYYILSVSTIVSLLAYTQEIPEQTQQQLENISENLEAEPDDDNLLQQLELFRKHPLSINTASKEDLQSFRLLTDLQIANLLQYRRFFGVLVSIYELQAIPTWDLATIRKVLPFITTASVVNVQEEFLKRVKQGDSYVLFRESRVLEKARGYTDSVRSRYLGSRDHVFFRYRYQFKNLLQYGITADKDAGEQFFKGVQSKGFDFYSIHFFARRFGMVQALALGDFTVNLGQGLIHWQSLAFKKSSEVISVKRQSAILRPYSSAGEFYFNRGAGITVKKGNLEATTFGSFRRISGNISADTSNNEEFFTSFSASGLHRNTTEIADRNKIDQLSFGGNFSYNSTMFKIGVNTVHHQFSKVLQKRDLAYNRFALTGKQWSNYSLDYSYTYRNVHLFGEAAVDKDLRRAFVNGVLLSVDPKVDVSLLYRNIQAEYQSVYGNAFTENVSPTNENGFYAGIIVRPSQVLQINGYADFYRFPFLKFRTDAPARGQDYLLNLTYKPQKQLEVYVRYRNERKQMNEAGVNTITNNLTYNKRENLRVHLSYKLSPVFTFKSRAEAVFYNNNQPNSSEGFLTFIEGSYKRGANLSTNLRIQYFETDDFNSRIYAYESDVLYSFSIPAFFEKGLRYYVNVNYDINRKLTVWGRLSQTIYHNKSTIGSSLDVLEGNKRTQVKLQFRYIF